MNAEWFEMATNKQIENVGASWGGDPDWQSGYGFQFWRCTPRGVFRGDGAYGQFGIVMTEQDAVLVIQSASQKVQAVLTAVWEHLLPAMEPGPLPEDYQAYHVLANRLKDLELNPMLGMRNPGGETSLNGAVYTSDQPLPGIRDIIGGVGCVVPQGGRLLSLGFCFEAGKAELVCHEETGESRVDLGMNGHFATTLIGDTPYGANSSWRDRDVLEVHLRNVRMAAGRRFQFRFAGDKMTVCATPTLPDPLGLGELPLPKLNFSLM